MTTGSTTSFIWIGGEDGGQPRRSRIGGKAHGLARSAAHGHPVPAFFVVTVDAFRAVLEHPDTAAERTDELLGRLLWGSDDDAARAADGLRLALERMKWPCEIREAIRDAQVRIFGEDVPVAVRSSSPDEDSTRNSFAGVYRSVLDVRGSGDVLEAVKQVWASSFGPPALAYRRRRGLGFDDVGMAVVVQRMVVARRAGVMFTNDPVSGDPDTVVIDTVDGDGRRLVRGEVDAETVRVRKSGVGAESPGGRNCSTTATPEARAGESEMAARVAETGIALEQLFGCPQDVEFCIDEHDQLFLLQTRPVTGAGSPAATGNHLVWDNSNIIESYSGVTTPLTFSFIRRAYGAVYRSFAEVMGIPARVIREHDETFDNVLGLFRGRVYYNLKSWYRLVRLFPGYRYNSRFMETMMGLREPLRLEDPPPRAGIMRRWFVELPRLAGLLARMFWKFLRIRSTVSRFQREFDAHYERWRRIEFSALPADRILRLYREMESTFLSNWKAPIINDFYVMVCYGVLTRLSERWCEDRRGAVRNGLLCDCGGLESAEPARLLLGMARIAASDQSLRELILREPPDRLPDRVAGDRRFEFFQSELDRYLDKYGSRCENELKLEAYSHRDRPERVYQIVRDYLRMPDAPAPDEEALAYRRSRREEAERIVERKLSGFSGLPRRWIFRRVLHAARLGIRNRERLRLARAEVYGIARAVFRSIGRQFADCGILDDADDVFYLTTDEIWDYVRGTAVTTDLRSLCSTRRREYDRYRSGEVPPPDNRFETRGMAYFGNDLRHPRSAAERSDDQVSDPTTLHGIGCCPGIVEGRVQVVHEVAGMDGFTGDVLVAPRTDPGWVPLFPAFRAMVIERGSLLSHSAIVAREMGIPTVVAVPGLLDRVRTGQRVRVDGRSGTVEILSEGNGAIGDCLADGSITIS